MRIVFDASAKYNGTALNDVIYQGPKLQNDLFNVLLRFRRYPVALICDIAEMYLRVKLCPKDKSCHRFLWRNMNVEQKPLEYEFNSLVFGVNSSPFLAQFVSQYHAGVYRHQYPRAAEVILQSTYMDDSMVSVMDETEGVELYKELSELPYGTKILHGIKFYGFTLVGTTVKLKSINFYYCIAKILSCFDKRKI